MTDTRGERNRNPGNLERNAILWQGRSPDQSTDSRFVVFTDAKFGIRALAKVLLKYQSEHGCNTVKKIIDRWAPPNENDTGAYVNHVAASVGVEEDQEINVTDPVILEPLVKAIIAHENGRVIYDDATIIAAIDMALT